MRAFMILTEKLQSKKVDLVQQKRMRLKSMDPNFISSAALSFPLA